MKVFRHFLQLFRPKRKKMGTKLDIVKNLDIVKFLPWRINFTISRFDCILVKIQAQIQSKLKKRKKCSLTPLFLRLSKSIFWVKNKYFVFFYQVMQLQVKKLIFENFNETIFGLWKYFSKISELNHDNPAQITCFGKNASLNPV